MAPEDKAPLASRSLTSSEIRQSFQDFFAARGHEIVPSSSLVPADDPTLLFTNAGMVQFKDVFLGSGSRAYKRAANSQKCMRVAGKHNDLEDVGTDDTHHTFFEMLGNWSFGDYYKQEAISWAWELLTETWGLPKERFWATCFEDELGEIPRDDEAAEAWTRQPGFDPSHILFFGREENFWEMADTGPSGPDSEIHYDLGPEHCDQKEVEGHQCRVNGGCSRFLELWNLVFIQYNRTGPTALEPLPSKHVDTGMGFERIVSVLQGVDSNYRTDLFSPLFDRIQSLGGHSEGQRQELLTPYRVISDHVRAATFLIADGVVPGNTGRNYVCRMIIRRASRFGAKAGFRHPFLGDVAQVVVARYGEAYPELRANEDAILSELTREEERFQQTVDVGLSQVNRALRAIKSRSESIVPGDQAFDLYATYGMPLEITRDIAHEQGMSVDEAGFRAALETHRVASGAGKALSETTQPDLHLYRQLRDDLVQAGKLGSEGVEYDPYGDTQLEVSILALIENGGVVDAAKPGDRVDVVLPRTQFYVEAGGQVADSGFIVSAPASDWKISIEGSQEPVQGLLTHFGRVVSGQPKVGDAAVAVIHEARRSDIMRNHTATHLLHAALKKVLGDHARQAGSLVAPDRLRFDFTHPSPLSQEEIRKVEAFVNEAILADHPVSIAFQSRQEATQQGAIALFGESYGDTVRTVRIGNGDAISYELCGGTHVAATGTIGTFLIVSEASVAARIRRIEAVTGKGALALVESRFARLKRISDLVGSQQEEETATQIEHLLKRLEESEKELARLRRQLAHKAYEELVPERIGDISVMVGSIPNADGETLRSLADRFRAEYRPGVMVIGSAPGGRPVFITAVSQDLVARGLHAGELAKSVAAAVGGSGGGKATLAQAGGKDAERLPEALASVPKWVKSHLD